MSLFYEICTSNCVKMALFEPFQFSKIDQTFAFDHYMYTRHILEIFLVDNFPSILPLPS